jgi:hypothetical protein
MGRSLVQAEKAPAVYLPDASIVQCGMRPAVRFTRLRAP